MELTSDNVEEVFSHCLFVNNEDPSKKINIEGVKTHVSFNKDKLALHKQDIESMLFNIHPSFMSSSDAGGWSFLNFCFDKDEQPWTGLQVTADCLICMGLAINKVEFIMPRHVWSKVGVIACYLQILN
jgi:hypothetical protein